MSWPSCTHTLPDGRRVQATYEGEPVGWVVLIVGNEETSVAARDIRDALVDILELDGADRPDWLTEAADTLAARETPLGRR